MADYGHYFLGSIIISDKEGVKFIIDGQQRLTTLTLLLIFLQHQLEDAEQRGQLADLIFSQKFGRRSFNLDIPERTACMEALYSGRELVGQELPESLANIMARYGDIDEYFPEELRGKRLPYFVDWLIENVHLVEITAYSDDDAYTIFETMNDRGLSLTPADMLKGYLLAHVTDDEDRLRAGQCLEGAHHRPGGSRQGRGCRRDQGVAEEPVRRDDPGPQARSAAGGLRSDRYRVSSLGP